MRKLLSIVMMALLPFSQVYAQTESNTLWELKNFPPLAIAMIVIIFLLIGVIYALTKVIISGKDVVRKRIFDQSKTVAVLLFVLGSLATWPAIAQDAAAGASVAASSAGWEPIGGLSAGTFYFLLGIILVELIVIFGLLRVFKIMFAPSIAEAADQAPAKPKLSWIDRFNASKKATEGLTDEDIDLGHDYDGIGELDNPVPPWWRYGFILSMLVSVIYVWRYDIAQSAPNQYEELAMKQAAAEVAIQEYLANSANNVDENTVTLLTEPADLAAAQTVFINNCAACHANDGGGLVGPNLTDDYWLHGGSLKDVFKVIKYGVTEKGMKSWKDDLTPKQIAQLASYIMTLKGTTPAEPKEPQGQIYNEETETAEVENEVVMVVNQ